MDALIAALTRFPKIKREDTTKLYYKKYPYRVVFDFMVFNKDNGFKYSCQIGMEDIKFEYIDTSAINNDTGPRGEFRIRSQGGYTNIYFMNDADAADFIERNTRYISSVSLPDSNAALSAIKDDVRIEIRDSLFWHRYRWAAVCKSLTLEQVDEVREWINGFKEQIDDQGSDRVMFSYSSSSPRIFFAEEDDLFMFKFSFFNRISRLEKVLLKKEIADEFLAVEGAR